MFTMLVCIYAQFGVVSPKIDVHAFGVVLYELISAKEAVVKTSEFVTERIGRVAMFEGVLNQSNPTEDLRKLVDPRLRDNYPIDSVSQGDIISYRNSCANLFLFNFCYNDYHFPCRWPNLPKRVHRIIRNYAQV
ncbi:putative Receptor protein kinase [Quillaja saponaria]|uniref:Receptor protein kinase n=1 Tax=Quillaja saponaria TaxID=32244 RepID=A0AAD7LV97_QUISA|nr:putative Receptor protein kinase [Quillaja saponaria]